MPIVKPLSERLWARVAKSDGCWEWQGYRTRQGYGVIGVGSRLDPPRGTRLVHRVSWELVNGPIPDGLSVCHKCDNPPCVNPAHLFIGTNADNVADRERKGRNVVPRGEHQGNAKLTEAQVRAIHADPRHQIEIAKAFGVSQATVSRIKIRAANGWRHLELPEKRTFRRREKVNWRDVAILGGDLGL